MLLCLLILLCGRKKMSRPVISGATHWEIFAGCLRAPVLELSSPLIFFGFCHCHERSLGRCLIGWGFPARKMAVVRRSVDMLLGAGLLPECLTFLCGPRSGILLKANP